MGKETRIGALWAPSKEGETMPLGNGNVIMPNGEKLYITVWRNRWKQPGEKSPDFYIDLDTRDKQVEHAVAPPPMEVRRMSPYSQPSAENERPGFDTAFKNRSQAAPAGEFFADDIPF
jgi:hypothetical protein